MLDTLLNRILSLDPNAGQLLEPLVGRRIRFVIDGLPETTVRFHAHGVDLSERPSPGDEVDAEVHASREALRALLFEGSDAVGRFRIRGEISVVERLRDLFQNLRPDWEEPLTRILGERLGRWSAQTARDSATWTWETADQASRDLAEWLTEESGLLAHPEEIQSFLDDVDRLRADADRLAWRVQRLERSRS